MKSQIILGCLAIAAISINTGSLRAQTLPPSVRTPQADNTLNTQVSGTNDSIITGGLSRGQTLFHSFTDFSIPTGGSANFRNPAGTRDIITRVTGGLFSDINGTLNSGGANFLLINPNGVIFGPNARLNVGRAFAASTANGVDLIDGQGQRYTFGTNGVGDTPLLTINPNVLFNISRLNFGTSVAGSSSILNYGTLQTSNDGQYIGLFGGNVTLDGRYGGGEIVAPGGRVDIGGLNTAGTISIDSNGLVLGGSNLIRGDVLLLNGAQINVSANLALGNINIFRSDVANLSSSININANNLQITNDRTSPNLAISGLYAGLNPNIGIQTATSGGINIDATGQVLLNNGVIYNTIQSGSNGKLGNIQIGANSLTIDNGSNISSRVDGAGNAGNINISTTGDISVSGTVDRTLLQGDQTQVLSSISASSFGQGDTGRITIATKGNLSINNRGGIDTFVNQTGTGNSQGIQISAGNLNLRNFSKILADNRGTGNAGNIDITTTGDLTISGTDNRSIIKGNETSALSSISSDLGIQENSGKVTTGKITIKVKGNLSLDNVAVISTAVGTGRSQGVNSTVGNSQGVSIAAKNLSLTNVSSIDSSIYTGTGNAGDIDIKTTGDLTISGTDNQSFLQGDILTFPLTQISSFTNANGNAGKITIDAQGNLAISNRGGIFTTILNQAVGNSQGIKIKAENISLNNLSRIESASYPGTNGNAGNIDLFSQKVVSLDRNSSISSSSQGQGEAANISISSGDITLNNSSIVAFAASVKGGNIQLMLNSELLLKNNSNISTNSGSSTTKGDGGNITINSPLIIAAPGNNDITANAYTGNGGRVNITSQGLFGIQYRPIQSNLTNDITASSTFGQSGSVNISTPNVDPGKDSTQLPNVPSDASNQISQVCSASNRQNKLTVTGRGGLPPNASDPLTADVVWQDARGVMPQPAVSSSTPPQLAPPAVGWVLDKGRVTLVAAGVESQPIGTSVACPNVVGR